MSALDPMHPMHLSLKLSRTKSDRSYQEAEWLASSGGDRSLRGKTLTEDYSYDLRHTCVLLGAVGT